MSDDSGDPPLTIERVMDLVGDAMVASFFGAPPEKAAAEILRVRRPSKRELAAARRENQEVHSGLTPDILRPYAPQKHVPEDVVRLRRVIDDILVAAQHQLESLPPG